MATYILLDIIRLEHHEITTPAILDMEELLIGGKVP
jgi:hypothetical protein